MWRSLINGFLYIVPPHTINAAQGLSDKDINKLMYTELNSGYLQNIRKKALRLLSIKQKQIISEFNC